MTPAPVTDSSASSSSSSKTEITETVSTSYSNMWVTFMWWKFNLLVQKIHLSQPFTSFSNKHLDLNFSYRFLIGESYWKSTCCSPFEKNGAYCFAPVGQSVFRPSDVHSISFHPSLWKLPILVQTMSLQSKWTLLIFRSHVQGSKSKCLSMKKCCALSNF